SLSLVFINFLQIYGQGTGLECRHHVQKLNLLQGEAEEAIGWTFRYTYVTMPKMRTLWFAVFSSSLMLQERKAEVSRWSKYLDKDSEDQEVEEEAGAERQQFCCQRTTVEEQRKQQKSFLSGDVQEYAEENGVFQLAYQAKKHNKCLVAGPDPGDEVAASGDTMVPAVCESVVPEETTQTPAASTKPSKWEKFLSCSDNYSGNAAGNAARVTLLPQEGSGRLGLHSSTTAADAGRASGCSEQAGKTLPRSTVFQFKEHITSTEGLASKLPGTTVPSTGCSAEEEMLFKEPQSQLIRAGSGGVETTGGSCCLDSMRRANTLANFKSKPQPSNHSYAPLFCTGDEFDDDL
ncbi:MRNIP protein, partial [Galbula dea]|nr:MRNIP protein [Galbula dea]